MFFYSRRRYLKCLFLCTVRSQVLSSFWPFLWVFSQQNLLFFRLGLKMNIYIFVLLFKKIIKKTFTHAWLSHWQQEEWSSDSSPFDFLLESYYFQLFAVGCCFAPQYMISKRPNSLHFYLECFLFGLMLFK